jgi:two-component system sensor kinase FixL
VRDLTARKKAERDITTLEADLSPVGRVSEMGQTGATLAHQLNQPLWAIDTYLEQFPLK